MRLRKPDAGRVLALVLVLGGLASLCFVGCDSEALPRWPWWTAEDSGAVRTALADRRDTFNPAHSLAGTLAADSGWRTRVISRDSSSETGDTLYKFGHLLSVRFEATDSGHANVYEWGPSVDTLEMDDTFCFVSYYDSMVNCLVHFEYDSLWAIGFLPDTQILPGPPPETLIGYDLSYAELRGYETPQTATKTYAWKSFRGLHLPKDGALYEVTRTTGFEVLVPGSEDAPDISFVIIARPGQTDTVFDRPTSDVRGLMNLRSLDSLYTFEQGDEVQVRVELRTTDAARFFAGSAGTWSDITSDATTGDGTIVLSESGLQHIFVHVMPTSMMDYPDAEHYTATWAIPVRVQAP